ncbi:MAG: hypothetical protein KatS3mg031_3109 [Chitinophagales bacterium]|nr:MAG: hypothetical protein KatS3mg031_3109 [Chitinophagales bacterium]
MRQLNFLSSFLLQVHLKHLNPLTMKKLFFITSALMLNAIVMKAQITFEHTYTITQPGQYNLFLTNLGNILLIITIMMLFSVQLKSQITLDFENDTIVFSPSEFYCIDIGENESKYIHFNVLANSFSLYNLDMRPFLMNVALPNGDSLKNGFVVMYVTRTLFDCDSTNIEYAYSKPVGSNVFPFRIIRTDGTVLLQIDSARGPYHFGGASGGSLIIRPIKKTSEGTKLFLDKLNPSGRGVQVYSLCGELPTDYIELTQENSYVKLFPNPADMKINFEVVAPNNFDEFKLVIYESNGTELKRNYISSMNKNFILDVSNFNSGAYFYSLISREKVYQRGKFIITK